MNHARKSIAFLFFLALSFASPLRAQESRLENNQTFIFDTSSMLFIAVERHEIRVEIMIKGIPLVSLMSFDTDGQIITIDQQKNLKSRAMEFFANRFILSLEGIPTKPDMLKADFLNVGDVNSVIKEEAVDEPLADTVLGLSYVFSLDQVPEYFQFAWSNFPEELQQIPAEIRVLDKVQRFKLNKYILTIDWSSANLNFQLPPIPPVPVKETNWLGHPQLDKKEAVQVVGQLLANIYNAFEYRDESTIYDKLAVSVDGKQLASIYLEQRKRMEAVSRGGPQVKILNVSMSQIEELNKSGSTFTVKGNWEVSGRVTHFGHTHERKNLYQAKLTLFSIEKQWKIIKIDVLEEKRIK